MLRDKRTITRVLIYTGVVITILYLLKTHQAEAVSMQFAIENQWNSHPITGHAPVQITLSSTDDGEHLSVEICAPFFNDPLPPCAVGPCPELWNYEVVELFFLSSVSHHYVELEFSPHGHYLVLLLTDRRQELKQMLPLPFYEVDRRSPNEWKGRARIPRSLFPAHVDRFNAYAIHGQNEQRTYEALYPAPADSKQPDFHRLELFRAIDFESLLHVGERDGAAWTKS